MEGSKLNCSLQDDWKGKSYNRITEETSGKDPEKTYELRKLSQFPNLWRIEKPKIIDALFRTEWIFDERRKRKCNFTLALFYGS